MSISIPLSRVLPLVQAPEDRRGNPDLDFRAFLETWSIDVIEVALVQNFNENRTAYATLFCRFAGANSGLRGYNITLRVFDDATFNCFAQLPVENIAFHLRNMEKVS